MALAAEVVAVVLAVLVHFWCLGFDCLAGGNHDWVQFPWVLVVRFATIAMHP